MRRLHIYRHLLAGISLLILTSLGGNNSIARGEPAPQVRWLRPPPMASQIFGGDNRRPVTNTTVYPWSTVGEVQAFFGNIVQVGTGVMIGNKTILTAAHVVYEHGGGPAEFVDFIPALSGNLEPFGRATVVDRVIPQAYIDSQDEGSDIAILALDQPLGTQTGIMPISAPAMSFFDNLALLSAGYPADLAQDVMYSASGNSLGVDGNFLLEMIDTEPGQSGSPIWYDDSTTGEPRLVAILKGTRELTDNAGVRTVQGVGVRITPAYAQLIDDTLQKYGDTPQNISVAPGPAANAAPAAWAPGRPCWPSP